MSTGLGPVWSSGDPYARREQMFPRLTAAQIARVEPAGRIRSMRAGEVVVEQGDTNVPFFVTGVYYGATHLESQMCVAQDVIVVGGGNSAGQAAVFLSQRARHVHVIVRSAALSDTMSRYLVRR